VTHSHRPAAPRPVAPVLAAFLVALLAVLAGCALSARAGAGAPPKVGDKAADFTWTGLDGGKVRLSAVNKKAPVALVVLRGFPGYQCPVCNTQVGGLIARAGDLAARKTEVILVYPGPADGLKAHADEFVRGKQIPANFRFVLDPDYAFTNAYGLRWDAPNETAYPSTFVLAPGGKVTFAKVSNSHGGRATPDEILSALPK
jgi:peroxiredoxin